MINSMRQYISAQSVMTGRVSGCLMALFSVCASPTLALPSGSEVISGSADIVQDGHQMQVQQDTEFLHLQHDTFNVGQDESVHFIQPHHQWLVVNEVQSADPSQIYGKVSADAKMIISSPGGLLIGEHGSVDASSLLLTTMPIDSVDGQRVQFGASNNSLRNEGLIQAASHGTLLLIAPEILNKGVIESAGGQLSVQIANAAWVQVAGDKFAIEKTDAVDRGVIHNQGLIKSDGGQINIGANFRERLYQTAVNNDGVIQANAVFEENGNIVIQATNGDVINNGEIDVSRDASRSTHVPSVPQSAGSISIEANRIAQQGSLSANGTDFNNGGKISVLASEVASLSAGSMTQANAGTLNGDGGSIVFFSPQTVLFREGAEIEAKGGTASGSGGFVDVSGHQHIEVYGSVNTAGGTENGTFLIDPFNVTISNRPSQNTTTGSTFQTTSTSANILASQLESNLKNGSVIVLTTGAGAENGDITVEEAINLDDTNNNTLTLQAAGDILIQNDILDGDSATADQTHLILNAGGGIVQSNGVQIRSGGGDIQLTANSDVQISHIDSNGGDVSINTSGNVTDGGDAHTDLLLGGGQLTFNVAGNIGGVSSTSAIEVDDAEITLSLQQNNQQIHLHGKGNQLALNTIDINNGNGSVIGITADSGTDIRIRKSIKDTVGNNDQISLNVDTPTSDIIIADHLDLAGNISLKGADIRDQDHQLRIFADQVVFESGVSDMTTELATDADAIDMTLSGSRSHLRVIGHNTAHEIRDLNADGMSLNVHDGYAHLTFNGSINLLDQIRVQDQNQDNVEGGWMYLGYRQQAIFGGGGALNIRVDGSQEAGFSQDIGFDNAQFAVQQIGTVSNTNALTFGGGSTLIEVLGGDMVIDITNGSGNINNAGAVSILSPTTIRIANQSGDAVSDAVVDPYITLAGQVQTGDGRNLVFNRDVVLPPDVDLPTSEGQGTGTRIIDIIGAVESDEHHRDDNHALRDAQSDIVESKDSEPNVNLAISGAISGCDASNAHEKRCKVKAEIGEFLGRFLIGGAMKKAE